LLDLAQSEDAHIEAHKRFQFGMANLLFLMIAVSAVTFTAVRETQHQKKQKKLESQLMEYESTDLGQLKKLNGQLAEMISKRFEANRQANSNSTD